MIQTVDLRKPTYAQVNVSERVEVGDNLVILAKVVDIENGVAQVLIMDDEMFDRTFFS